MLPYSHLKCVTIFKIKSYVIYVDINKIKFKHSLKTDLFCMHIMNGGNHEWVRGVKSGVPETVSIPAPHVAPVTIHLYKWRPVMFQSW